MSTRRKHLILRKGGGIILALGGLIMIANTIPLFILPLLLGLLFIWIGWHLYAYNPYCW